MYVLYPLQLLRKRHIGNDIVTVIFQDTGCKAFSPRCIRSQFQHIFIVVRVEDPCSSGTKYRYVSLGVPNNCYCYELATSTVASINTAGHVCKH